MPRSGCGPFAKPRLLAVHCCKCSATSPLTASVRQVAGRCTAWTGCPPGRAWPSKDTVTITGLVKSVQIGSVAGRSLEVQVLDQTGGIRLLFFGRTAIAGIVCGAKIRATGRVGDFKGHLALANPRYELLP